MCKLSFVFSMENVGGKELSVVLVEVDVVVVMVVVITAITLPLRFLPHSLSPHSSLSASLSLFRENKLSGALEVVIKKADKFGRVAAFFPVSNCTPSALGGGCGGGAAAGTTSTTTSKGSSCFTRRRERQIAGEKKE